MRNLNHHDIEQYRRRDKDVFAIYGSYGDHESGVFSLPVNRSQFEAHYQSESGPIEFVLVVAACAEGWEHVSVSLADRCPTWFEMDAIKRLFFEDDEWCFQIHPAVADHIDCCRNCLHIWRNLIAKRDHASDQRLCPPRLACNCSRAVCRRAASGASHSTIRARSATLGCPGSDSAAIGAFPSARAPSCRRAASR